MRTLRRFLTLLLAATVALTATAYGNEGDQDRDGIIDSQDNCKTVQNPDQADRNANGVGDACDDPDRDGLTDLYELNTTYGGDVSPRKTHPDFRDTDGDGLTDGYEVTKTYGDGRRSDPTLRDTDGDGWEDGTEAYGGTDPTNPDTDGDGVQDSVDNCALHPNPDQKNTYGGPRGDACEPPPPPPPCPTADPCQVGKLTGQIEDATGDTIDDVIAMLPTPDTRQVANFARWGSDGYALRIAQEYPHIFKLQVVKPADGTPFALDLPAVRTYSVNGPVGVYGYATDTEPFDPTRINVSWRYNARSKVLTIKVLKGQSFTGPVAFGVPVVGYPADCTPTTAVLPNTCDGNANGFYNALKITSQIGDPLDAVPYVISTSA